MSRKTLAAIAFLAMAVLTMSCGVLAEEIDEMLAEETNVTLDEDKPVMFMFVQTAQSGTLVPVEGVDNLYTLTLMGVAPQTIAFSDRPERIVVGAPMQQFLDGMCFSPENPPNAALEILEADEKEDLAVVELFNPVYDNATQTLQYNVSILELPDLSYAVFNERADQALPETFGPASLFIDGCPRGTLKCCRIGGEVCGEILIDCCWKWNDFSCQPCESESYYFSRCRDEYGQSCTGVHTFCFPVSQ